VSIASISILTLNDIDPGLEATTYLMLPGWTATASIRNGEMVYDDNLNTTQTLKYTKDKYNVKMNK
jgi:hypothetical protein